MSSKPLSSRAFSAGHFELTLDGLRGTSYLKSVEGGFIKGNVAEEPIGPENLRIKHITMVEIEPISIELGLAGARDILAWIQTSWRKLPTNHCGQITHADFNLNSQRETGFYGAIITETTFPTLDGSSKEAGYLKVKLQPERVQELPASLGTKLQGNMGKKQKSWIPSAFRLNLDGLDCSMVSKIEGFTIKQGVKKFATGESRFAELAPTKIEFPNLVCYMAASYAKSLEAWQQGSLGQEKSAPMMERTGSIDFLSADRSRTLFSIILQEVGLVSLSLPRSEANQDQIKRVRFEMYVGRMDLFLGGSGFDI